MPRRKNSAADTVLALPNAITTAILETISPSMRAALSPEQAAKLTEIAVTTAGAAAQVLAGVQAATKTRRPRQAARTSADSPSTPSEPAAAGAGLKS